MNLGFGPGNANDKEATMKRYAWILVLAATLAVFPPRLQAQAAAEYATTTSAIGSLGAKVSSALGAATKQATQTAQKGVTQPTLQKNAAKPTPANPNASATALADKATTSSVSTVRFDSTPSGAAVSVDNVVVAHTPATLTLPKGIHVIEMKHDGYAPWQNTILLAGGEKLSLNPALKDPKAFSPIFTVHR
jgi:flagellar hook protein FlgE